MGIFSTVKNVVFDVGDSLFIFAFVGNRGSLFALGLAWKEQAGLDRRSSHGALTTGLIDALYINRISILGLIVGVEGVGLGKLAENLLSSAAR